MSVREADGPPHSGRRDYWRDRSLFDSISPDVSTNVFGQPVDDGATTVS